MYCGMMFKHFPFDTQHCLLNMESFAYSESQVQFRWLESNPLSFPKDFGKPNFIQVGTFVNPTCVKHYSTGNYSCLEGFFSIKREYGFYIIYAFLPSTMCVLISWIGFWVGLASPDPRIGLGKSKEIKILNH